MDKLQYYALFLSLATVLGFGIRMANAANDPHGTEKSDNVDRLIAALFAIAFELPIYGRIFGWW